MTQDTRLSSSCWNSPKSGKGCRLFKAELHLHARIPHRAHAALAACATLMKAELFPSDVSKLDTDMAHLDARTLVSSSHAPQRAALERALSPPALVSLSLSLSLSIVVFENMVGD